VLMDSFPGYTGSMTATRTRLTWALRALSRTASLRETGTFSRVGYVPGHAAQKPKDPRTRVLTPQ